MNVKFLIMKQTNNFSKSFFIFLAAGVLAWNLQSCSGGSSDSHNHEHDADSTHEGHAHDAHAEKEGKHDVHWSYAGESGPEKWANLCPSFSGCSGDHQSPIDIKGEEFSEELTELNLSYIDGSKLNVVNNGHSVQVNYEAGSKVSLDSVDFELKQFHFHCPSEHTVGGEAFPMEVHLVHVSADKNITVVGVLVQEGEENPFLASIINEFPTVADSTITSETPVNITTLLPVTKKYYKYNGSLTTPPCTEGVNWFVLQSPVTASKEQIEQMKAMMPANNARPVQPLNDRAIKTN